MVNNKISKKGAFGTTMGVASIIAILVILVLIVFAALSITTAKADLNLSEKTAEMTTGYYEADSRAEEMLAEVVAAARGGEGWTDRLGAEYTVSDEDGAVSVSYESPLDDNKALFVKLRVTADGGVSRELWQVRSTGEWNENNDIQLIIE
jgi:Na+-transporting methylmalonyl-CoA/oxaloacetate decarboxylase gamma subunit